MNNFENQKKWPVLYDVEYMSAEFQEQLKFFSWHIADTQNGWNE